MVGQKDVEEDRSDRLDALSHYLLGGTKVNYRNVYIHLPNMVNNIQ
jgi:hypothetical protein